MDINTLEGIKEIAQKSYDLIIADPDYFEWSIQQGELLRSIFDEAEESIDRNSVAAGLLIVGTSLGGAVSDFSGKEYDLSDTQYATALFANEMGAALAVAAHQLFTSTSE